MRIDIMTDIETLGRDAGATILQISAIAFDIKTGEHLKTFNEIADIGKNKDMNVNGATIKWWLDTDKDLLAKLVKEGNKYSSKEVVGHFQDWLSNMVIDGHDVYLWGNGILFDNRILQHQMQSIGLPYPIFYRNDRDMRTIVDLASVKTGMTEQELRKSFKDDTLIEHNAFDDVKNQIKIVSECYKILI